MPRLHSTHSRQSLGAALSRKVMNKSGSRLILTILAGFLVILSPSRAKIEYAPIPIWEIYRDGFLPQVGFSITNSPASFCEGDPYVDRSSTVLCLSGDSERILAYLVDSQKVPTLGVLMRSIPDSRTQILVSGGTGFVHVGSVQDLRWMKSFRLGADSTVAILGPWLPTTKMNATFDGYSLLDNAKFRRLFTDLRHYYLNSDSTPPGLNTQEILLAHTFDQWGFFRTEWERVPANLSLQDLVGMAQFSDHQASSHGRWYAVYVLTKSTWIVIYYEPGGTNDALGSTVFPAGTQISISVQHGSITPLPRSGNRRFDELQRWRVRVEEHMLRRFKEPISWEQSDSHGETSGPRELSVN